MSDLRFDIRIVAGGRQLVNIRGFQVTRDHITFLFGESGIGKSLIARAIYGLLDPEEFTITVNGETYKGYLERTETKAIRENSFFVFQEPSSHLNPLLPLQKQLREGDLAQASNESKILSELWELRAPQRNAMEIEKLLEVYPKPHRPSGGEKQRMFLAMAIKKIDMILESQPENHDSLFVFDEPTGSLDNHLRDVFLASLFKRFQQHRFTVLLITHDYSMISVLRGQNNSLRAGTAFRELRRSHARLEMSEFRPETYTGWLEKNRKPGGEPVPHEAGRPLLSLESPVVVFSHQLVISRDPLGREICPLEVFPRTIVYLKAPSGEGKTTVMKLMMGLIQGEHFKMSMGEKTLTEKTERGFWRQHIWGRRMTMVFQHADESLNPHSRVKEIFEGLPTQKGITPEGIKQLLGELFEDEMSDDFLNTPVSVLSGGQKQRLNLSRAFALDAEVLLLDEPLNGLDFESVTKVLSLLEKKQRAGRGVLIVSHNEEIVSTLISDENTYFLSRK